MMNSTSNLALSEHNESNHTYFIVRATNVLSYQSKVDMLCFLGATQVGADRVCGCVKGFSAVAPISAVDVSSTGEFVS